ncbi:hypothetical protein FZW96_07575 [Bacillus sp. BGMRC 2118]|nr:hypothetical protein FZW96_07575 [Bacillus sp. BGMRC 2118]
MRKKTKILGIVTASILALGVGTSPASAAKTVYGSWSNPAGSYAPTSGSYYTTSAAGVGCNDTAKTRIYSVKYNSSEVTAIKNYYNNNSYYHGLDVTDMSNKLDTSTGSMSSNYPGYKFDTDDDDGNGNDEEAEVVSRYSTSINTTNSYSFYVDWTNRGNMDSLVACAGDGYVEINAHESWNMGIEYQTKYHSLLGTSNYYKQ